MKTLKAYLTLSPEHNHLVKDLLSMTQKQISEKYGPLGDNIQFNIEIDLNHHALFEIVPHNEQLPTVEVTLYKNRQRISPQIKKTDLEDITGKYHFTNVKDLGNIEIIVSQDEALQRIGKQFVFEATGDDGGTNRRYHTHDGEICTIRRALTPKEADILAVGLMWEAEFPNGDILHIFDHELRIPIQKKVSKLSLSKAIANAQEKTSTKSREINKENER